jgi:hypothetical protein
MSAPDILGGCNTVTNSPSVRERCAGHGRRCVRVHRTGSRWRRSPRSQTLPPGPTGVRLAPASVVHAWRRT